MAAYNFQEHFVPSIESGQKTNTIRRIGKRRHARPGEKVQLYYGMRTKSCRRIIDPDPVCLQVLPITIDVGEDRLESTQIGDGPLGRIADFEEFAKSDGFPDAKTMYRFWRKFHGVGRFEGVFVRWSVDGATSLN